MKNNIKTIISMLIGASLVMIIQMVSSPQSAFTQPAFAKTLTTQQSSLIQENTLTHCEMFFNDDRDSFESEINKRIKPAKLIQSNVIWSETTKQLGFYAMICY